MGAMGRVLFLCFCFPGGETLGGAMGAMGRVRVFSSSFGVETLGGAMGAMGRVRVFFSLLLLGGQNDRWSDGSDGARVFFVFVFVLRGANR